MSGLVVRAAVVHILVANFVDKNVPLLIIVVVAVGSSAASDSDVVAQLLWLLSPRWPPVGPPGR